MNIIIEAREIKDGIVGKFLARNMKRFSVLLSTGKIVDIYHYKSKNTIFSANKEILSIEEEKEYNKVIDIIKRK